MAGENSSNDVSTETQTQTNTGEREAPVFVGSATGQPIGGQKTEPTKAEPTVIGKDGAQLSPEAISERVKRGQRTILKEVFGEEIDIEKAKMLVAQTKGKKVLSPEEQKEFERLRRLEEVRKRSRQTEAQKTEQAIKAKDEEIKALRAQIKEHTTGEVLRKQDETIVTTATNHVDPKFTKYAKRDFAEFVNTLRKEDPAKFAKLDQKGIDKWFADYAKANPHFAKQANAGSERSATESKGAGAAGAKPPVQRVVTTTKTSPRLPPNTGAKTGEGSLTGKTPKPGQANSMNKSELRQYMKQRGLKNPY